MDTLLKYITIIFILLVSCKKTTTEISENTILKTSKTINLVSEKSVISTIINPKRNYNRTAINKVFDIKKREMHAKALKRGYNENIKNAVFTDGYTGKRLLGGTKYEYDHVRSAEYIYNKYKSILTDDEIAQVVNCNENIITTSTKINRAKGKRPLENLLDNINRKEELGINLKLAIQTLKNADKGIQRKIREILLDR